MKRMARIYVSSSWHNEAEQQKLVDILRQNGHKVYDFTRPKGILEKNVWEEQNINVDGCDFEDFKNAINNEEVMKRFSSHRDAMLCADTCILLLPCGRSSHVEAGFMAGMNKRVIVYNPQKKWEPELMYGLFDYGTSDIDDLLEAIAEPVPGVCQVCGCTDDNPCFNEDIPEQYCSWANPEQTLCTFCANEEIYNDPKTIHCCNDISDVFK